MAAPRKYLDADKVEVNPKWLEWRKAERDKAIETAPDVMAGMGIDPSTYFPELDGKEIDPEDGAWILVLEEPFTELRSRFRVPVLSLWKARYHELNSGGVTVGPKSNKVSYRPKQAVISTPGGDLHLWAHEYSVVEDPYELMTCDPAVQIHSLGGEPVLDDEQLFYLQSRGVTHQDAAMLMIKQVPTDYIYATFPEDVVAQLQGVGIPLWRHVQMHPRGVANA